MTEHHYSFPEEILELQRKHPLLQDLHICRAGYFPQFNAYETYRPEGWRESHIMIYCTSGQGWYESQGQRWTIRRGQVLFVMVDEPHAYGGMEMNPWTMHWIHFNGLDSAEFFKTLGVTPQNPLITIGEQLNIIRLFDEVLKLCQLGYSPHFLLNGAALLRQILSQLAFYQTFAPPDQKGLDIEQMVQFMLDSVTKAITVSQLADHAGLSRAYFSRQFTQRTGYPPLDYFIRLKMQRACELLNTSDLPVQAIGRTLGYSDPYYFSRQFKKTIGVSPKNYRDNRAGAI